MSPASPGKRRWLALGALVVGPAALGVLIGVLRPNLPNPAIARNPETSDLAFALAECPRLAGVTRPRWTAAYADDARIRVWMGREEGGVVRCDLVQHRGGFLVLDVR